MLRASSLLLDAFYHGWQLSSTPIRAGHLAALRSTGGSFHSRLGAYGGGPFMSGYFGPVDAPCFDSDAPDRYRIHRPPVDDSRAQLVPTGCLSRHANLGVPDPDGVLVDYPPKAGPEFMPHVVDLALRQRRKERLDHGLLDEVELAVFLRRAQQPALHPRLARLGPDSRQGAKRARAQAYEAIRLPRHNYFRSCIHN